MDKQHILIIGATSAIATHCARVWAERGSVHFTLVGRNQEKLQRVSQDLCARGNQVTADSVMVNGMEPQHIHDFLHHLAEEMPIDMALIAHGYLPDQRRCQQQISLGYETLMVNAISPVLFAEAIAHHMEQQCSGTLAVISSVAGDRGRQSNYVYGAAKGLVTRYVEGLQHRFAKSPVKIVLIKPGPTETPMTMHLVASGAKLSPVEPVAEDIVKAIDRGQSLVYTPKRWRWIMLIIQHLPKWLFHKLNI